MGRKYLQNNDGLKELKEKSQLLGLLLANPNVNYTKQELMSYSGMSERKVREELEWIANFYPIRATAGSKGYKLIDIPADADIDSFINIIDEVAAQIVEVQNRIDSLKARLKPLIALSKVCTINLFKKE